jgi:hypothetical protein
MIVKGNAIVRIHQEIHRIWYCTDCSVEIQGIQENASGRPEEKINICTHPTRPPLAIIENRALIFDSHSRHSGSTRLLDCTPTEAIVDMFVQSGVVSLKLPRTDRTNEKFV